MEDELDLALVAQTIVDNQDGDTVARILNDYADYVVEYEGDSIWVVDDIPFDEHEIVSFVEELLYDLDKHLQAQVIDYYG